MAGHLGDARTTVKKLTIVRADAERNLLLVRGTVPGPPGLPRARSRRPERCPPRPSTPKLGEAVGTVDLPEALFGAPVNTAVLHQVVTAQLAGRHLGTHDTKTRGEVRGGGAKPYRQKGTGRARQGSRRAPHYAGGGVVFGPHPRSYEQQVPRKHEAPRPAWRADVQDRRRRGQGRAGPGHGGDPDARAARLPGGARVGHRPDPGRGAGARREARAVGPQPAPRHDHPGRLAQLGRHPEGQRPAHRRSRPSRR